MFSMDSFLREYKTNTTEIVVRGKTFHFYVPSEVAPYVKGEDLFQDFPLWAKIWEASWVLADFLGGEAPEPARRFLELGCGVGLVGIVASSFGHRVTMTENNPHALDFARANAELNRCSNLEIVALDWRRPELEGPYDGILGSEIVYREEDFQDLLGLIRACLRPGGEVLFAAGLRRTSIQFFAQMQAIFDIEAKKKVLRSRDREIPIIFSRMTPKEAPGTS
ncbi:MAG: class I SAM-dependent methyltransferase [Deltaproteobacteria bacterium]|nr:class I SAM-dependent methyltransferase [Deltaproteobacteria bacterium]